jgi:hypothetical protein
MQDAIRKRVEIKASDPAMTKELTKLSMSNVDVGLRDPTNDEAAELLYIPCAICDQPVDGILAEEANVGRTTIQRARKQHAQNGQVG